MDAVITLYYACGAATILLLAVINFIYCNKFLEGTTLVLSLLTAALSWFTAINFVLSVVITFTALAFLFNFLAKILTDD